MKFTEAEIAYMALQTLGRLATVQRSGTLQKLARPFRDGANKRDV